MTKNCSNCKKMAYIIDGVAYCKEKGEHNILYVCLDWSGKDD